MISRAVAGIIIAGQVLTESALAVLPRPPRPRQFEFQAEDVK